MSKGFPFAVGSGALWGILLVAPRLLNDFSVADIAFGRFLAFGMLVLLVVWCYRRDSLNHLKPGDFSHYFQVALFGNLLFYFALIASTHYLGAVPACILVGILPGLMKLRIFIPGNTRLSIIMLALLLVTAIILNYQEQSNLPGVLLLLVAAGSWQISARLQARMVWRRDLDGMDHLLLSGIAILPCLLLLLPFLTLHGPVFGLMSQDFHYPYWQLFWLIMLTLALFSTLSPRLLWQHCVKRERESLLHWHALWQSLFGLLYWFLLEQRWPSDIEQILLIGYGLGLIFYGRRRTTHRCLKA